jgi:hypothetical protein
VAPLQVQAVPIDVFVQAVAIAQPSCGLHANIPQKRVGLTQQFLMRSVDASSHPISLRWHLLVILVKFVYAHFA